MLFRCLKFALAIGIPVVLYLHAQGVQFAHELELTGAHPRSVAAK